MLPVQITDGTAQPQAATGPGAPTTGLDISTYTAGSAYMIEVEVTDLHSATGIPAASITIEDTVNAFAASTPVCEVTFTGPITKDAAVGLKLMNYGQAGGMRLGTASAKCRAVVQRLSGGTPSITYRAALWA